MVSIKLPNVAQPDQFAEIQISTSKPFGIGARVFVQEVARKLEAYQFPIESDLKGQDKTGREIEVNTLGRWLFGVPGVNPHVLISAQGNTVFIRYPAGVNIKVSELMNSLKESLEVSQ